MGIVIPAPPINLEHEELRHCPMCNCKYIDRDHSLWLTKWYGICTACGHRGVMSEFYRANPFGTFWVDKEL